VTIDGEALDEARVRKETLFARLDEVQQRSHILIERSVINLSQAAERRGDAVSLRTEAAQLRGELRTAISEYVTALKAMGVQPERMLILVKKLVEAPMHTPELTARELREELIRTAIEAYYAA
jgi:hypothetical protein